MKETPADHIELLVEKLETYAKTSYELAKLRALDTATRVVTALVAHLSVIIVLFLFGITLSVGLALWLGELLGKTYYGFFIVAAFYLLAGIVMHFFLHRWLKKPISSLIITQALQ